MSNNREIQIYTRYADAILHKATHPLDAGPFEPNWTDQPSRHKIYRQVERLPLSFQPSTQPASLATLLRRMREPWLYTKGLTFDELSTTLLLSLGVLNRRLGPCWSDKGDQRTLTRGAIYGRGTASGGGLYPAEIYWACGASSPLIPGVYHYDTAHHALERLWIGNIVGRIRAACMHHTSAQATDQFLLISLNFWKNAFKYRSLSYHLLACDLGALLCSLCFTAMAFATDMPALLWYHDKELDRCLGLETTEESVFAVVPIPLQNALPLPDPTAYGSLMPLLEPLTIRKSFQRSKTITRSPVAEHLHSSALIERELCIEAPGANCDVVEAGSEQIALPPPAVECFQQDLREVFQRRKSSFGRFSHRQPLTLTEVATMLYSGTAACKFSVDLKPINDPPPFVRPLVFAVNVEGLERGIYAYDAQQHCLWTICKEDIALFLQKHYSMPNYNMEEIGAVFALVGRTERMLEIYGNRGYRILNAEAGFLAQAVSLGASALSIGSGIVFGFDAAALTAACKLEKHGQKVLLCCLVGHERAPITDFSYRLV